MVILTGATSGCSTAENAANVSMIPCVGNMEERYQKLKVMDTSKISKTAEELAEQIRELFTQRNMVEAEIQDLTRKVSEIDHQIERPTCKYNERARLATELQKVRQRRRALKDWMNINQPYMKYIGSDDGDKAQKMLSNLVGVGRRVKNNMAARAEAEEG